MLLPILANDIGSEAIITVIEAPDSIDIAVEDGQLRLTMTEPSVGTQVLTYRISNGVSESTASVTLVHLGVEAVVDSVTFVQSDPQSAAIAETDTATGWTKLIPRLSAPPALRALADLELPLLGFSLVGTPAIAAMAWMVWASRKRRFATVDGVSRTELLEAGPNPDTAFLLRHDANRLWLTGRAKKRRSLVEVETPNGTRWIPRAKANLPTAIQPASDSPA